MTIRAIRWLFFNIVTRFVVLIVLGLNVRHRRRLPDDGPAIIVANHNSHLDTLVLMTLLPAKLLPRIQPVAALDYFLRNRLLAWFALNVIGILPVRRGVGERGEDPFADIDQAIADEKILVFFPEGSRGEPERLAAFKKGIARLAQRHAEVPVTPVFLHGLGKALPKGEALLVPFFCDVFIGERIAWAGNRRVFMQALETRLSALAEEGGFADWE